MAMTGSSSFFAVECMTRPQVCKICWVISFCLPSCIKEQHIFICVTFWWSSFLHRFLPRNVFTHNGIHAVISERHKKQCLCSNRFGLVYNFTYAESTFMQINSVCKKKRFALSPKPSIGNLLMVKRCQTSFKQLRAILYRQIPEAGEIGNSKVC